MNRFFLVSFITSLLLGIIMFIMRENVVLLAALILLMIAAACAFTLTFTAISKRIRRNIETINKGQLNLNVRKTRFRVFDSISAGFNDFLNKIRGLIASFSDVSKRVVKDAHEIERQAETIKLASGEIAATIQNITESVSNQAIYTGNMMGMIQNFAQGARDISDNAETSLRVAEETKLTIEDSFKKFGEIKTKIQESKGYNNKVLDALGSLDNKIREINSITETVEGIASQTQLLSLNASIEAARAGEEGKGFAVVAAEVGKLAEESSRSAKGIKQLIDGVIGQINELSGHINEESGAIEKNLAYTSEVLKKSGVINDTLESNMEAAKKITVLTKEQLSSLERIEKEIENINDITQQNAAVSQEISASTEEQLATIEAIHGHIVKLLERLEESNSIVGNFMKGFEITEQIKQRIEQTKVILGEITKNKELLKLDEKAAGKYLRDQQAKVDFLELIAIIDSKGILTAATVDVPENFRDCSSKPYFTKACSGETYISEEYISVVTHNYNISVSVPFEVNGVIQGVVTSDININEM
ncbi:MAG: methyl-accepting chemotaxis protein [Caulobacteraceae bacterium]